jgi:hypothetical protein
LQKYKNTKKTLELSLISMLSYICLRVYRILKRVALPTSDDFGLEVSNIEIESGTINVAPKINISLERDHIKTYHFHLFYEKPI